MDYLLSGASTGPWDGGRVHAINLSANGAIDDAFSDVWSSNVAVPTRDAGRPSQPLSRISTSNPLFGWYVQDASKSPQVSDCRPSRARVLLDLDPDVVRGLQLVQHADHVLGRQRA